MYKWRKPVKMTRFAAIAVAALLPVALAAEPTCYEKRFAVTQLDGAHAEVFAEICGVSPGAPVQVLLHGGAYDHRYWDVPHQPDDYSYVAAAVAQGYATVNLDRLGYGASTRPAGQALTFAAGAAAVAQVITQIESGALGVAPGPIILNGHSMGGIVAEMVAGAETAVAAMIVSGLANTPDDGGAEEDDGDAGGPPDGPPPFVPATSDPRFDGQDWAEGYLVTAPGVRPMIFHAEDAIAPEMVAVEEAISDTLAVAELAAVMGGGAPRPTFAGPTLYVLGQFDRIACEGQDCAERFAGTDWHEIIPGAGHSLNLSLAAPEFYALTFRWLAEQGLAP